MVNLGISLGVATNILSHSLGKSGGHKSRYQDATQYKINLAIYQSHIRQTNWVEKDHTWGGGVEVVRFPNPLALTFKSGGLSRLKGEITNYTRLWAFSF